MYEGNVLLGHPCDEYVLFFPTGTTRTALLYVHLCDELWKAGHYRLTVAVLEGSCQHGFTTQRWGVWWHNSYRTVKFILYSVGLAITCVVCLHVHTRLCMYVMYLILF